MNIVLLQAAAGPLVTGPIVRVPKGSYMIEKIGDFLDVTLDLNGTAIEEVPSKLILSDNSNIKATVVGARNFTLRLVKEKWGST